MFGVNTAYAAEGITVKLSPYILGEVFGVPITATLVTTWLTMALLIALAFTVKSRLKAIPGKLQSTMEVVIGFVFDYIASVLENRELAKKAFPIIMTIFLFILALNWVGLMPGVTSVGFIEGEGSDAHLVPLLYPANTDLNITIGFAIVAFFTIEIIGILTLGLFTYFSKFINFRSPIGFIVGIIELASELVRLVSFSFRLFGNIFAGKVLLLVIMFFVPYIIPMPLILFEIFVGFVQAFVFAILTLYFIKLAVEAPH